MNNKEDQKTDQFRAYIPDESEFTAWMKEGDNKLKNKEYKQAAALFEKVLRVDPENLDAYEKLSIARSALADIERVEDYMIAAQELVKQNKLREAREEYLAVLDIDRNHQKAIECLKTVENKLGISSDNRDETGRDEILLEPEFFDETHNSDYVPNTNQDTEVFEPVKQTSRQDLEFDSYFQEKLEEALRIYESGSLENASKLLETLSQSYPDHPQVKFYLGAIKRRQETEGVRKDQFRAEELLKKGMQYLENEQYMDAKMVFSEILSIRPDFSEAQVMLDKTGAMLKSSESVTQKKLAGKSKTSPDRQKAPGPDRPAQKTLKRSGKAPAKQRSKSKVLVIIASVIVLIGVSAALWFTVVFPNTRYKTFIKNAHSYIDTRSYSAAREVLESALKIQPDSMEALLMLGHVFMEMGFPAQAVDPYRAALDNDSANDEILFRLGKAYYANDDWSSAKATFHKIQNDSEFWLKGKHYIAMSLKSEGQIESAAEAFENIIELDENNTEAYFNLAACYRKLEMYSEAEDAYLNAIRVDPKFVEAYTELANFYREQKQNSKGIETLQSLLEWYTPRTVERSAHVAEILVILGEMQYDSRRYNDAIETYSRIIQIEPSVEAYRNLGRSHYRLDRLNEAILVWREGLNLDRMDSDLWWQIGVAQFRQGNLSSAETSYKEALRYDPDYYRALTNLGFLYHQQYKFDLARRYWRQSLEIEPNQPRVREILRSIDR
jgi:tetratricopeptide (TPR) repeat protein